MSRGLMNDGYLYLAYDALIGMGLVRRILPGLLIFLLILPIIIIILTMKGIGVSTMVTNTGVNNTAIIILIIILLLLIIIIQRMTSELKQARQA